MQLIERLERRVTLPGDSETARSQKALAVIVLFVSAISTALNGLRYRSEGLDEIAVIYFALAAVTALGFFLFLAFPRIYLPLAFAVLTLSFFVNGYTHLLAGGYTSGLQIIQWGLVVIVLAVLFVPRNMVFVLTAVYILFLIIAGYLDPAYYGRGPELDPGFVAQDSTTTLIMMTLLVAGSSLYLFNQVERYRRRADDLLLNILPGSIAERLKESPETIADGYREATVLFADIVDFTTMSSGADPVAVVNKLNEIFSDFDALAAKHGLEKIKTIGDAYMVAGGLPEPREDHCQAVVSFAFDILDAMARHTSWTGEPLGIRIGINSGPVVAGVIGRQKFIYDLWGDAVNVASRMESNGLSNEIQVTEAVKACLGDAYEYKERGPIRVKGKGEMVTHLVVRSP